MTNNSVLDEPVERNVHSGGDQEVSIASVGFNRNVSSGPFSQTVENCLLEGASVLGVKVDRLIAVLEDYLPIFADFGQGVRCNGAEGLRVDCHSERVQIDRELWEETQRALVKLIHRFDESAAVTFVERPVTFVDRPYVRDLDGSMADGSSLSDMTPAEQARMDVDSAQLQLDNARQRAADLAAEDATFEGFAEFSDRTPIPYTLAPRVFERGDMIPDDVKRLRISNEGNKSFQVVERKESGKFGYLHIHNGGWGRSDTTDFYWEEKDFPLVEVFEDVTYSVFEAVDHLKHHGVDTDAIRLHRFLNTGAAWTDGFGFPRECVSEFLIAGDSMASVSPVPVELRFTPVGLAELVRIMKVAV